MDLIDLCAEVQDIYCNEVYCIELVFLITRRALKDKHSQNSTISQRIENKFLQEGAFYLA